MITKKMYVVVRLDLSQTYRCVQGAHALAQFSKDYPKQVKLWNNQHLIFLCVCNLIELRFWVKKLQKVKKCFSSFYEPDLDDQLTAICCFDSGRIFKSLRLAP